MNIHFYEVITTDPDRSFCATKDFMVIADSKQTAMDFIKTKVPETHSIVAKRIESSQYWRGFVAYNIFDESDK